MTLRFAPTWSTLLKSQTRYKYVPQVLTLYGDPKDEKYLNLAIAADAEYIVTRDRLLLGLMTATDANAVAFRTAYPRIDILRPEPFLARLP